MTAEVSLNERLGTGRDFTSILFGSPHGSAELNQREPDYFADLNLDQLVRSVISGREEYHLSPFFYTTLTSVEAIAYRHDVLHDLGGGGLATSIREFARQMRSVRKGLARAAEFHYAVQRQAQHLSACGTYLAAVHRLLQDVTASPVRSEGFTSLKEYLESYVASTGFTEMEGDIDDVRSRISSVRYRLHVFADRVEVSLPADEEDYAADVARTFARFRQGAVDGHAAKLKSYVEMNHVEAAIIDRVARLYPAVFAALAAFERRHHAFMDDTVTTFDREVQFYLAYLEFADRLMGAGLDLCFPDVLDESPQIGAVDAYDAALADKLVAEGRTVVTNDFSLTEGERVLVVTGPNQGGKTTFARMVGQVHHLAALGLPVPGRQARLQLSDRIFTHFEQGENLEDLAGKLEDDVVRIHDILTSATSDSLLVINEIFTSTSLEDGVLLGTRVLEQVIELGCPCVCVTFLDELSALGPATVSMVGDVDPEDPVTRTFEIRRREADGLAYAEAIAQKYRLTYPCLRERLAR
jgi:hypothetical protein